MRRAALILASAAGAAAWSCDGHMAVAQIALDSGIMSSATIASANKLIAALASQYPTTGSSFQEAACWADDIRSQEANTAGWHFIDIPVCRLSDPAGCTQPPSDDNVVWALDNAEAALSNAGSTNLDRERMVRFLIHFAGDIHQPLHASDYFSSDFPTGDRGGNSWHISGAPPATELHALWDYGVNLWPTNIRRPMSAAGFAQVKALADAARNAFPISSVEGFIKERNVMTWANESHALAEVFVYTAPQAPGKISSTYVAKGQVICTQQIAIAGYRLATALETVLSAPADAVYQRVTRKA